MAWRVRAPLVDEEYLSLNCSQGERMRANCPKGYSVHIQGACEKEGNDFPQQSQKSLHKQMREG